MSGAGPPSMSSLGSFKHSQRYANVATRYSHSRERERNAAEEGRRGTEREALLDDAERGGGSAERRASSGRTGWSCAKTLGLVVLLVIVVVVAVVYGTDGLDRWTTRSDDDEADGKTSTRTASDSARASRAARRDDDDAASVRPPPPAAEEEIDDDEEVPPSPPPAPRRPPPPSRPPAPSEEEEPASVDPYAVSPTPSDDNDENAYDDGEERDPSTVNQAADVGTKTSSKSDLVERAIEASQSADGAVETEDETPSIAPVPESSLGQAILRNRRSARAVHKFVADPTVAPGIGPNVEPVTPREPVPVPRKGENK